MATRQGSQPKGKGRVLPTNEPDVEPLRTTPSEAGGSDGDQLDNVLTFQAQLQALQSVQVNQVASAGKMQKQMDALEQGMAQILAALNRPASQPLSQTAQASTPLQDVQIDPSPRASPSPSTQPNYGYKPKKKDPPEFDNNDGPIQYKAWKEQILDKFEEDEPQFSTPRSYMSYVFNRTTGDANKHLFPRYTRDKKNRNPYTSYQEMFETLDIAYLNAFEERDARNDYRALHMGVTQSFQDFQTEFIHLANDGRIPEADRFDDMYDKLTTALQDKLLVHRQLIDGDFNRLCTMAAGVDSELKRLNTRRNREREAREVRMARTATPAKNPVAASRPNNPVAKPTSAGFALLQRPTASTPLPVPVNTSSNTVPAKRSELQCYNCLEPGHISRDCTKPRRATVNDIEEEEFVDVEDIDDPNQGKDDA
jgi:hypothetical protein